MKTKYRSVFISDIHLGSRGCKAEELAKFLDSRDNQMKWITNTKKYSMMHESYVSRGLIIGKPLATPWCTVEQLENIDSVGVYEDDGLPHVTNVPSQDDWDFVARSSFIKDNSNE